METLTVGQEIANQLGSKCLYMIGAKNLIGLPNGLSFKIMKHPLYNYIEITLNSMDTYDMKFFKYHGGKITREVKKEGVYNDQLHEMIREVTGLATSLGKVTFLN